MIKIPRILTLSLMMLLLSATSALAAGNSSATIGVSFSNDGKSATITSDKDVSNYTVVLCSGTQPKVEGQMGGTVNVGPFDSPIVSVTVKSGTTTKTVESGVDCEPPPCNTNCNEIPEVPTHLAILGGLLGMSLMAFYIRRRRSGDSPA